MNELKTALAQVFLRHDAVSMPRKDMVMGMSMELRWFSPGTAEQVVDAGLGSGLLREEGGALAPTFHPSDVEVPLDFKPSPNIIAIAGAQPSEGGGAKGTFMEIVDAITEATGVSAQDIIKRINEKVMDRGFTGEVAALLVGAEDGVELTKFYDRVDEGLRKASE